MAEVVKELPRKGNRRESPWGTWLDGQVWKIERFVDTNLSPRSFRASAHTRASRCGCKATTRVIGNTYYVQAIRQQS